MPKRKKLEIGQLVSAQYGTEDRWRRATVIGLDISDDGTHGAVCVRFGSGLQGDAKRWVSLAQVRNWTVAR